MKIVVVFVLLMIVGSLGSALFYLIKDKGSTDRAVKALTIRVGLSMALFLVLMGSYYFGLLPGHRL